MERAEIDAALTASLDQLLGYTRRRLADPELAADTLQDSLLKALRAAPSLREQDRILPWFYRILDNSIKDAYRKKGREYARRVPLSFEPTDTNVEEDEQVLCACFLTLLPALKPEYRDVLEFDLKDPTRDDVAEQLGITKGNLKVRRHRARQRLRMRLEEVCRLCAQHGCLDCTCGSEQKAAD